jgi:pimeloyl-ACP methyl ester carboxylesterase
MSKRRHGDDLRAVSKLAVAATQGVIGIVEEMHRTIASGPRLLGRPLEGPARLLTAASYGAVRGVTALVGGGIDQLWAGLAPLLGGSSAGPQREAALAVLNGVVGDFLESSGNPLATEMQLRCAGKRLDMEALPAQLADGGKRLVVLIHGSCMNDLQWLRRGHDHGAALARDLGITPIYALYNSGLHISQNGRALAQVLEQLLASGAHPLEELVLIGHSMGGLVARSACGVAEAQGLRWRSRLGALVCLGSPHHGAPLERGGNWIDVLLGVFRASQPLARVGQIRSAGVTDLRYGATLDEHWQGRDRFAPSADSRTPLPLPAGVRCYAVAGTLTEPSGPDDQRGSDGLVPVASALGQHRRSELTLAFPPEHQWVCPRAGHLDLLDRAEVYERLRGWLA